MRKHTLIVTLTALMMAEVLVSQAINRNNTLVRRYCSEYGVLNDEFFQRNLNSTLSSLRRQLVNNTAYHTVARTIINGESVYGLALCREYLSNLDCLKCFDIAVKGVKVCGNVTGGHVIYDDCDLRYENNNFYSEANVRGNVGVCGNQTSSQPAFTETVKTLLSNLRVATPRTPQFYAASTRRVTGSNVTIYAISQCNINISQSDCAKCLSIRSTTLSDCLPNTNGRAIDAGCFVRYSNTAFFRDNQTTDLTPFLKDGDSSTKRAIIGGITGGSGLLLIVLVFVLCKLSTKSRDRQQVKSTGATELLQGPAVYRYNDLVSATNNFSQDYKIGEGGFGEVYKVCRVVYIFQNITFSFSVSLYPAAYRVTEWPYVFLLFKFDMNQGKLNDGEVVAIKKTMIASRGRKAYFSNELKIISNIHHRHLMRLLGYCNKGPHMFLVLEFMENGSLDKFLYGGKRGSLSWKQRFEIIFGIARGLAYLHEQYHVTIVHRDIKSSNILLDNDFQPKISDFGLVRLLPEDKTHISTKVAGTFGFVAPEYAIYGQVSEKVDVYSFGVVVLEIISGRRCTDGIEYGSVTHNLVDHAWNLYENGIHANLMDIMLDTSEYEQEDVKKIIELSLKCTQSPASTRPSMSEVVSLLSDRPPELRSTMSSTFTKTHVHIKLETSTSDSPSTSNATASNVELSGR